MKLDTSAEELRVFSWTYRFFGPSSISVVQIIPIELKMMSMNIETLLPRHNSHTFKRMLGEKNVQRTLVVYVDVFIAPN